MLSADASVFVAPFEVQDAGLSDIASRLGRALGRSLSVTPGLELVPLSGVGDVHDMSAALYAQSCPPGQFVGCAYVLGETAGVAYSVTGAVHNTPDGTVVQVHVIDVLAAQEAVSFQASLVSSNVEVFSEGVAGIVYSVSSGAVGRIEDIRSGDSSGAGLDVAALSQQLDQLSHQLGESEESS